MTSIFDHTGIAVSDFARSKAFYAQALAPLGITVLVDFTHEGIHHAGLGIDRPVFWIGDGQQPASGIHLAFTATSRADVDAFHALALASGGTDNGAPGIRAHYHPDYYGAFVLDPDGYNIEAVCHAPA